MTHRCENRRTDNPYPAMELPPGLSLEGEKLLYKHPSATYQLKPLLLEERIDEVYALSL